MKKFKYLLLWIIHIQLYGQNAPHYTPMTPEPYSLFKYTEIPVSMTTGIPNISIPIHIIQMRNFELPISLDYHSGGIKTDEIATNVGLGWTLKAGGMISNQVFGYDDNTHYGSRYPSMENNIPKDREFEPQVLSNRNTCSETYNLDYYSIKDIILINGDTQPDVFYYNYGAENGKFFLTNGLVGISIPYKNIEIKKVNNIYEIIDNKGTVFTYSTIGETNYLSIVFTDFGKHYYNNCGWGNTEVLDFETGNSDTRSNVYYLTKVKNIYGEEINIEYENEIYHYKTKNQYIRFKRAANDLPDFPFPNNVNNTIETQVTVKGKRIKKITSTLGDEIEFIYDTCIRLDLPKDNINIGGNEVITGANRLRIIKVKKGDIYDTFELSHTYYNLNSDNIPCVNNTGESRYSYRLKLNSIKKNTDPPFIFEYYGSNILPDRRSYNIDHFGYMKDGGNKFAKDYQYEFYEGSDREPDFTSTLKGTLKSITYPTKGKTVFTYELNSYYGPKKTYYPPETGGFSLYVSGIEGNEDPVSPYIIMQENLNIPSDVNTSSIRLAISNPATQEHQTTDELISMSITNVTTNQAVSFAYPPGYTIRDFYIAPGNYLVRVESNMEGAGLSLNWTLNLKPPTTINETYNTGGLRIKAINHFADNQSLPSSSSIFEYTDSENSTVSTGRILHEPEYSYLYYKRAIYCQNCGTQAMFKESVYLAQKSSNVQPLDGLQGYHVMYPKVRVYNNENKKNGMTEYVYSFAEGDLHKSNTFPPTPSTSLDFLRGNLIQQKEFRYDESIAKYKILKSITNEYTYNYNPSIASNVFSPPNKPNEKHAIGLNIIVLNMERTCSNGGFQCTKRAMNLELVYYKIISPWVYLNKSTEVLHDTNGNPTASTQYNYFYENPLHGQMTKSTFLTSTGQTTEKQFFYPHDLVNLNIMKNEMNELIVQRRLSEPPRILYSVIKDGVESKISETIFKYEKNLLTGNLLLPVQLHKTTGNINAYPFDDKNIEYSYKEYDTNSNGTGNGNVLEYQLKDQTPIVLLWGFNKRYVVAEIKNATLNEVKTALGLASGFPSFGNLGLTSTQIRSLKLNLPKSLSTTYTYKPLVGIASKTDPNGITTYYDYDEFGRLIEVYIKNEQDIKQVIQKYNYRYATQP
ncbi:MAG: RHS repeat domain-containing protein [Bacteroidia bacterium]|nr:RHS repeat domain-containing protein [Bacteroidia bacterium]